MKEVKVNAAAPNANVTHANALKIACGLRSWRKVDGRRLVDRGYEFVDNRASKLELISFDIARNVSLINRDTWHAHAFSRGDCLAGLDERLLAEGITDACGEVWLHTYPRMLGVAFKPVSFWYCHRRDGTLAAIVAEVNNTFGGRHCYLLTGDNLAYGQELLAQKQFHVSPFCQIEGGYRFRFMRTFTDKHSGTGRTVARIVHDDAQGPLLLTSVSGELAALTPQRLRQALWRMPLMTLGVIARIHWQALRLLLKRVPFFGKGPLRAANAAAAPATHSR